MITVDFWRNRLGGRIVALMIGASAVLSVGAAGIQLYLAYQRDRARVFNEFAIIEASFRDGLESALWKFNFDQVEVLLDGIYAQHDIVYLHLVTPTDKAWTRGSAETGDLVLREFTLLYRGRPEKPEPVGMLTAGLSLEYVQARILEQFWALVLSNFIKTFLASIAMLAIFDRLAARHLRSIAGQTRAEWLTTSGKIAIDRPRRETPDELDDIIESLNHARRSVRASHAELSERVGELAALNDTLADLNNKLADANREQSEFTYAISHDLKSPTNTVSMLLRELRGMDGDDLDPSRAELFEDLDATVTRMGRLVEDVLAYARSVGEDMSVETVNLQAEVEAIIRDLAGDIASAGAAIRMGNLPTLTGNAVQLRLLLQNLISNAIKFRDPDRPPVVEIDGAADAGPGWCSVRVKDNGIGIDASYHDQIFGLFKRLHNQSAYKGSGIGLTVCQRIVSNHGGKIEVFSEKGGGSVFNIMLPRDADGP